MVYKIKSFWNYTFPTKPLLLLFFCSFLLFSQSCSTYRVVGKNSTAELKTHKKTMWTFAWGMVQARDYKICNGKNESGAIDQIKIKTNLGFILLSTITAGIVVPIQVECHCAKVKVVGGSTGPD